MPDPRASRVFVPLSDDYAFEHPEVFLTGELEPFSPGDVDLETDFQSDLESDLEGKAS